MAFFDPRRPSYLENPYPALRELRRNDPVHWSPDLQGWVVTRFDDCARVLQATAEYSSRMEFASSVLARRHQELTTSAPLARAQTLSTSDGEAHTRLRRLASPGFSAAATSALDGRIAERACAAADRLASGAFDLMEQFADPVARDIGLLALGVPADDLAEFWRWVARIEFARSRPAEGGPLAASRDAVQELAAYLPRLPASSVLGSIWGYRDEIGVETALSVAVQIAAVGSGPTAGAIGNALVALLENPSQEAAIGAELPCWIAAADEFCRYDSPAHAVTRFAVRDTGLGGRRIRAGSSVYVMIGSANRDEEVFREPERLDVRRDARRQLSFGHGPHFCLGAGLARRAIAHALRALRQRFPRIGLVEIQRGASFELRVPDRLFVDAR